jgi:hypothetical protein
MLTAYTRELDDVDAAVAEVLGQLNLEEKLLKNSVGIMTFYGDFLETGVVKAISDALPCDSIGGTTSNASLPGAMGALILTLTVLTSDDVSFKAAVSAPLDTHLDSRIRDLYEDVVSGLLEAPSLLLAIAPFMATDCGDDEIIDALDAASGGASIFGTFAITHKIDFSGVYTCFNGKPYSDALALVGIAGDIAPQFYVSTIAENRIITQKIVITESSKNCVMKINGIDAVKHLEAIGLIEGGNIEGINAIPFVLTMPDGSCVTRVAQKVVDRRGILFSGAMPQGSNVRLANCDEAFVSESTGQVLSSLAANHDARNMLCFSCIGRKWILGVKGDNEMRQVAKRLDSVVPYMLAYSGGEFCPVKNARGELVNHCHHFTFIACAF